MFKSKVIDKYSGYLFKDGKIINFKIILKKKIDYSYETGCLRIRTTSDEINVDFISDIKPTKKQLNTVKGLSKNRKLFFEIVNKKNRPIGITGIDVSTKEMELKLKSFYNK